MNQREQTRFLEENGFRFERKTNHGEMWSDGVSKIVAPNARQRSDKRLVQNFMANVRRARKVYVEKMQRKIKLAGIDNNPPNLQQHLNILKNRREAEQRADKRMAEDIQDMLQTKYPGTKVDLKPNEDGTIEAILTEPQKEAPVEPATAKITEPRPLTDDEATEFGAAQKRLGKTYAQIQSELYELGWRQEDGRPWSESRIAGLVVEKYPDLRERFARSGPGKQVQHVTIHAGPGMQGLPGLPAPAPVAAYSPPALPETGQPVTLRSVIKQAMRMTDVDPEKKQAVLDLLLELL